MKGNSLPLKAETTIDRIESYYLNSSPLSVKEMDICERLELVFSIFCHVRSRKETISKFMSLQQTKGKPLSPAQAYRDLSEAEKLFTPLMKYSKEFLRLVIIESAIKDIKESERRARSAGTTKEWTSIMRVKHDAERRIIEVGGLTADDASLPDFSKLMPHQFNINVPQSLLNALSKVMDGGVIDLTNIHIDEAEIIEEIKNREDDLNEE